MAKRHNEEGLDGKDAGGLPLGVKEELHPGVQEEGSPAAAEPPLPKEQAPAHLPPDVIQIATVEELIAALRAEFILELGRVRDQLQSQLLTQEGMEAELVGGIFNCPECGLRLNSPSTTGMKGQLYEHPFDTSPKLSGVQCKLKGRKFLPPIVFLRMAAAKPAPKPLTEQAE